MEYACEFRVRHENMTDWCKEADTQCLTEHGEDCLCGYDPLPED